MYHYQLHPPTQICHHLTSPCQHHLESAPLSSTFRDRSSTRPPPEREAGQPLGQRKTYVMPWQTCLVCPCYPFPSLLLLDPPALWQSSPPVNCAATSRATSLQHHWSLLPDCIRQSQRQAPLNDPSPGTSRILRIPSTDGACNKPTRNIQYQASWIRLPSTMLALSQVGLTASLTHVTPADLAPPEHKPSLRDNRWCSPGLESIPEEDTEEAAPPGGHHQPPTMPGGIH